MQSCIRAPKIHIAILFILKCLVTMPISLLFPKNLQYNSCCETGCCTNWESRQTLLNPLKNLTLGWAQKSYGNQLQENRLLHGAQIEKASNFLPEAKLANPSNYLNSTYGQEPPHIYIQIRKNLWDLWLLFSGSCLSIVMRIV